MKRILIVSAALAAVMLLTGCGAHRYRHRCAGNHDRRSRPDR